MPTAVSFRRLDSVSLLLYHYPVPGLPYQNLEAELRVYLLPQRGVVVHQLSPQVGGVFAEVLQLLGGVRPVFIASSYKSSFLVMVAPLG